MGFATGPIGPSDTPVSRPGSSRRFPGDLSEGLSEGLSEVCRVFTGFYRVLPGFVGLWRKSRPKKAEELGLDSTKVPTRSRIPNASVPDVRGLGHFFFVHLDHLLLIFKASPFSGMGMGSAPGSLAFQGTLAGRPSGRRWTELLKELRAFGRQSDRNTPKN